MPSRLSWLALGFGAYIAFVVATFPAATAYRWLVPEALRVSGIAPDTLRLSGVTGTVWDGAASLASVPGLPLHDLRWDLRGWPLLLGRVSGQVQVRLPDGFVSVDATATRRAVTLKNLRASTSLPVLSTLLPISGTQGLVSVSLDRLRLVNDFPTAVAGTVRIEKLKVTPLVAVAGKGPGLVALGDYEITFKPGGDAAVAAAIRDTGGPLEVNATLTLTKNRAYKLDAKVRPRADASDELVQGLKLMTGAADAKGFREFALNGSL